MEQIKFRPQLSFEEQFDKRDTVIVNGKPTESVELIPPTLEGNPVVYSLGWTGEISGCIDFFKGFYKGNKHVLSVQYPTHRPMMKDSELPEGFSKYGYRNAEAVVQAIMDKGLKKVDLVGHSEGTGITLMANQLLQEQGVQVDIIVLVNPVGFRDFSLRTNVRRLLGMAKQEGELVKKKPELAPLKKAVDKSAMKFMLRHPINTALEGLNVAQVDMTSLLSDAISRGQHVAILQAGGDPFVPYDELQSGIVHAQMKTRKVLIDELGQKYPDLLSDEKSRMLFDKKVGELNDREATFPLMVSVPESEEAGHLFNGFYPENPHYYVPITVDILNYFRTGEIPIS